MTIYSYELNAVERLLGLPSVASVPEAEFDPTDRLFLKVRMGKIKLHLLGTDVYGDITPVAKLGRRGPGKTKKAESEIVSRVDVVHTEEIIHRPCSRAVLFRLPLTMEEFDSLGEIGNKRYIEPEKAKRLGMVVELLAPLVRQPNVFERT